MNCEIGIIIGLFRNSGKVAYIAVHDWTVQEHECIVADGEKY